MGGSLCPPPPRLGVTHVGLAPVQIAYKREMAQAVMNWWKWVPIQCQAVCRRRCGVLGNAPFTSTEVKMRVRGSISATVSKRKMASWAAMASTQFRGRGGGDGVVIAGRPSDIGRGPAHTPLPISQYHACLRLYWWWWW